MVWCGFKLSTRGFVAANPEARVLVIGESGTGKETVALQINNRSARRNEAFYVFNCASVNPELLASKFFGHEKGAFTGADKRELGLFELASGGTLFLDEIGELPLAAQGLLLRVLEEGRFMRVGGTEEIAVDVRLITATNRNLPVRVREGKFRRHLTDEQAAALMAYDYPGNVRELLNVLERAVVFKMEDFSELMIEHQQMNAGLQEDAPDKSEVPDELDEVIRWHIKKVYQKYGQNVSKAAAALKITRNTLRKYL